MEQIEQLLKPLIKKCFRIGAIPAEFSEDSRLKTRFAGPVFAKNLEKMPVCGTCGKELSFVFQFRENPDSDSGDLIQFFYCFHCVPIGVKSEKEQWLTRLYSENSLAELTKQLNTGESKLRPCLATTNIVNMLPDYESLEEVGHKVVKECEKIDPEDPWDVYEESCMAMGCDIEPFSSIGGYPIWIQGVASKKCPECNEKMEFIAQIDSVPEVGLMWGDAGCVYLFRCKKHKDKFAMEMQCF
ncbi:MAG: hypothetical protein Kow0029_17070 [Candidatus Rifleibacteriota bacterium]